VVTSVQAVAGLIIQTLVDNAHLTDAERSSALEGASSRRIVKACVGTTGLILGGAWMGAALSTEVKRQAPPDLELPRTAQATLEVVDQLLAAIQAEALMLALVFDDTDRWFRKVGGTVNHQELALALFGTVLPELRQRLAGMVVAVHTITSKTTVSPGTSTPRSRTASRFRSWPQSGALAMVIRSRVIATRHRTSRRPHHRSVSSWNALPSTISTGYTRVTMPEPCAPSMSPLQKPATPALRLSPSS